jgi:hypothetical protein
MNSYKYLEMCYSLYIHMVSLHNLHSNTNGFITKSLIEYKWCDVFNIIQMVTLQNLHSNTNGFITKSVIEYKWCDVFNIIQMVTLQNLQ